MDQDQMGSRQEKAEHTEVVYVRNYNMSYHVGFDGVAFHAPDKNNGNNTSDLFEFTNYYVLFL